MVRALASTALESLILFAVADEHIRAVLRAAKVGLVARDLRQTLRRLRPDLEFKPAHLEPVVSDAHMWRLVRYELGQTKRHDLGSHPAIATGSCFPDLVGARLLPGYEPTRVVTELPAFRLGRAYTMVGLEAVPLVEPRDDVLHWIGVGRLAELSASVFSLPADLRGRSAAFTRARALAARLAAQVDLRLSDLADVLGVTRQSVWELARTRVDERAESALRRRWALEDRVHNEQFARSFEPSSDPAVYEPA